VIISIALTPLILKLFADFIAPGVKADFLHHPDIFLFLLALIIVVSVLSGFYPALLLSGYKPVVVLKNQAQSNSSKTRNAWLRKSLTVSQFVIAQFFIMATILVSKQVYYALHKDLGFKKDAIVYAETPYKTRKASTNKVFANKLRTLPGVELVSVGFAPPSSGSTNSTTSIYKDGKKEITTPVEIKYGDENYINTFGLQLVAGRNIFPSDTVREFLVNETLVKKLGLHDPRDIINKTINVGGKAAPVVGVMKDFYDKSFRSSINPVAISSSTSNYSFCAVKINLKNTKSSLASMERVWNETYPDYLYSYQFLDEKIARFYQLDNIMLQLIEVFAGIAILIGCLGLYGLVSFMALQKTKEIGVRKVLGASVKSILWLFGKEFSRLLIAAFIIAAPVAWWIMNKYLQDFRYRINIGFGIFALAILSTFVIAAITVSYRSVKAAVANPVKSLRTE